MNVNGVDPSVEMDSRFCARMGDLIVSAEKRAAAREVEAEVMAQRVRELEEENGNLRDSLQEVRDQILAMKSPVEGEGETREGEHGN